VQVWRLFDLKLLRTVVLPPGPHGSEQELPGGPHLLADSKTVLLHTFSCGLYQLQDIDSDQPSARHLKTFDEEQCDIPLRIGHYWVQTQSAAHARSTQNLR
jgi:hypothetical protein